MYIIFLKLFGHTEEIELSFDDKKEANDAWTIFNSSKDIVSVRTETRCPPKPKKKVVRVVFPGGSRPYTYLTKELVPVGSHVVVWTTDGRQVVTVIDSGEMSDAELAQICDLKRFRYIEGMVVAA